MLSEIITKLENWKSLTLDARDKGQNPVKYVEFTGQLNAIEATVALVKLYEQVEAAKKQSKEIEDALEAASVEEPVSDTES